MGESRGSGRAVVMPHKIGTRGPRAILVAAAAWERVQGRPAQREDLFRAWAALEGATVLSCYPLQRECWQRGWLLVGTCEVTAAGWAELEGDGGNGVRRAA